MINEEVDEMVDGAIESPLEQLEQTRKEIHERINCKMEMLFDKRILSAFQNQSANELEALVMARTTVRMLQKKYPDLQAAIQPLNKEIEAKKHSIWDKLNPKEVQTDDVG